MAPRDVSLALLLLAVILFVLATHAASTRLILSSIAFFVLLTGGWRCSRIGLLPRRESTLIIVVGSVLTFARVSRAKPLGRQIWGTLSWKGYLAVLVMAAVITWLMGIGGYLRSAVRLFWHAMEIFRDASPWAFTHTLGVTGNVIAFNTVLFWSILLFLVWLKREAQGPSATVSEGAPANKGLVVGAQTPESGSRLAV